MPAHDHLAGEQFYRWMHPNEYVEAQERGAFKNYMNVSIGKPDSVYKGAKDWVLVKFPHIEGAFEEKEMYSGSGRAAWGTGVPFDKGERL